MFGPYVILLVLSAIVLIGLAFAASGLRMGRRVLNGLIGVGFLGYAVYLGVFFHGGEYTVFWAVFILPVSMLVDAVRTADISDSIAEQRESMRRQSREHLETPHRTAATRQWKAARKAAELDAIRAKRAGTANRGDTTA